jgi:hypothetical protein
MCCVSIFQVVDRVDENLKVWLQSLAGELIDPMMKDFMSNVMCHKLAKDAVRLSCSYV